jgi:hypothetical protein
MIELAHNTVYIRLNNPLAIKKPKVFFKHQIEQMGYNYRLRQELQERLVTTQNALGGRTC